MAPESLCSAATLLLPHVLVLRLACFLAMATLRHVPVLAPFVERHTRDFTCLHAHTYRWVLSASAPLALNLEEGIVDMRKS